MNLYREFPPSPALAGHVGCLWTAYAVPHGEPVRHRVLPDNCIDILWQDAAPLGFVAGMMSRVHVAEFARPVRTVAVRFLPGAARAFFDLPLAELQDGHPALDCVWPRAEAEALAAALWERELPLERMFRVIEHWLLARLHAHADGRAGTLGRGRSGLESALGTGVSPAGRADLVAGGRRGGCRDGRMTAGSGGPADALARRAVGLIEQSAGTLRVEDLAATLGVSRQHLAAVFRDRVGLNAKAFAMVCRFRRAHAQLAALDERSIDWAGFALDHGYYDQSHLIHDFQRLAAAPPTQSLRLSSAPART